MKDRVRLVVIGDKKVGKTSLIQALSEDKFPKDVPECVGVKIFPPNLTPDHIQLEVADTKSFDTSSTASEAEKAKQEETKKEVLAAHVVILVYDVEQPSSFAHVDNFWMPWLRDLQLTIPVVLIGNKIDVRGDGLTQERLDKLIIPLMSKYREVETCVECSAKTLLNVADVFRYAQSAVLHPTRPLYDTDMHELRPEAQEALRRIFKIVDRDHDGFLNDNELNQFQRICFDQPLAEEELEGVKTVVSHNVPDGVTKEGMTESGFIYLHTLFVQRGRMETTWAVLRKFGYDDEQPRLTFHAQYLLPPQYANLETACLELSPESIHYLSNLFEAVSRRANTPNHLTAAGLNQVFATAPNGNPWSPALWRSAVKTSKDQGTKDSSMITLDGFISMWNLMTLDDYTKTLRYLAYLGLDGRTESVLRVIKSRKRRAARNVIHCLVVGTTGCGKSTIVSKLIEKDQGGATIANYRRSCAMIPHSSGDKFLVLTEVPEAEARVVLENEKHKLIVESDAVLLVFNSQNIASLEFVEGCARSLTNAPLSVIAVGTHADHSPAEGLLDRAQTFFTKSVALHAPKMVNANKLESTLFNEIETAVTSPASYMIMSSDKRSERRRGTIVKAALTTTLVVGAIAGLAFVGRYFWKTYSANKQ